MLRGSDGLDYENITERLAGNPARTYRNNSVRAMREYDADERQTWLEAFDAEFARQRAQTPQAEHVREYDNHEWTACSFADRALISYRRAKRDAKSPGRSSTG